MSSPAARGGDGGGETLAARFEAQAARHGARLAVRGERLSLTYGQLDRLANGIARTVRDGSGRAPGGAALLLSHGALAPAAVLGVLKAGGYYVPLDPAHPPERTAFILEDSGAGTLICDGRNLDAARALAARRCGAVRVLNAEDAGAGEASGPPATASPRDLCSVVYTSGSSGRPKGVCQAHATVLHATDWYARAAGLGPGDRLSLLHALGTGAGASALFGALLTGAALLPFAVREAGAAALASWIAREGVTCLHAVPTLFRRLCARLDPRRRLEKVRLVRLGGEPVTRGDWRLWRDRFPEGCRLLVGYSSTEALNVRLAAYGTEDEPQEELLPLGGAVPGKELLVLDAGGEPVRPGGTGEVFVRSAYLFAGYWRRPALSALALREEPGGRLRVFRTGDLARLAADGRLFHAGRVDAQVKIAGQRVEIPEVEQALRGQPGILDAAVVASGRAPGPVRLTAYAAVAGGDAPERGALREALRQALPAHMVPAVVHFVDELPLLPGGKVDRRALEARAAAGAREPAAPRGPLEEALAAIWQRALGVAEVGVNDDFFADLGGDSLAAVEILAAVEEQLQCNLPLSALTEAPTVGQLGARLAGAGWEPPASGVLAVNRSGRRPPLFGVCGAYGHGLRLLQVGLALGPDQPVYSLQPPGMDWAGAGCATIEAMAAHYLARLRQVQPRGPYRLIGTSFGGVVVFEAAIQLQRLGETVSLLAMVDTTPPDCAVAGGVDRAERRSWGDGPARGDRVIDAGRRVARAHAVALERYLAHARFEGAITFFWCEEQAGEERRERRALWGGRATGGMRIVPVPGRHGQFHREPQLSAVVSGLREALGAPGFPAGAPTA